MMWSARDRREWATIFNLAKANARAETNSKRQWSFIGFANSPFFLWLASAVLISLAGFLYSHSERCYAEAKSVEDDYRRLGAELHARKTLLYFAVNNAKKIEQVLAAIDRASEMYLYSANKNRTLAELSYEYERVLAHGGAATDKDYHTGTVPAILGNMFPAINTSLDLAFGLPHLGGQMSLELYKFTAKDRMEALQADFDARTSGKDKTFCDLPSVIRRITVDPTLVAYQIDRSLFDEHMAVYRERQKQEQALSKQNAPLQGKSE